MIPMVLLSVLAAFLVFIVTYLCHRAQYWKRRNVSGPTALPLIGNLWEHFFFSGDQLEMKRVQKFGNVYGTMRGTTPVITICDPDLLKQILVKDSRVSLNRRNYTPGDELFSIVLPHLNDEEWRRVRSIISPAFSPSKIKAMLPLVDICVENTLQYFDSVADADEEVDLKKVMISYTVDVTASCVFAMQTNGYKNPDNEFLVKIGELLHFKIWRIISSFFLPSRIQAVFNLQLIDKHLTNYVSFVLKSMIDERRKIKTTDCIDFIQLLLNAELNEEESKNMSNATKKLAEIEVISQCVIFLILGYETTATQLQFLLYELAMKPDIQNNLFEEIKTYFEKTESVDFDSLNGLPYLDAVLSETLRHYPPVINMDRVCSEDYTLGDTGITIEKGTIINIPFYASHHDPNLFAEPFEFRPEKFLPENRNAIHPYAYMPFGVGPRTCIGIRFSNLMSKLIVAKLLLHFEVFKCGKTATVPKSTSKILIFECEPLIVKFRKRSAANICEV